MIEVEELRNGNGNVSPEEEKLCWVFSMRRLEEHYFYYYYQYHYKYYKYYKYDGKRPVGEAAAAR